jgi:hypothetical protein
MVTHSAFAKKAFFRGIAELAARPKAIKALTSKLNKVEREGLMKKWETPMTHITEEERKVSWTR